MEKKQIVLEVYTDVLWLPGLCNPLALAQWPLNTLACVLLEIMGLDIRISKKQSSSWLLWLSVYVPVLVMN